MVFQSNAFQSNAFQSDEENATYVHAQAQAKINTTRVHAQSQGWIEQTYNGFGQAQATLKTPLRFAQAQARLTDEYEQLIINAAPNGYWPLEELSGTVAYGLVGPDGTYTGALTLGNATTMPTGYYQYAISNNNTSGRYGTVTLAEIANTFTLEGWAKPAKTITLATESNSGTGVGTSNTQNYMFYPTQKGTNRGIGVSVGTNGIVVAAHGDATICSLGTYTGTISGVNHVAVVVNAKAVTIYLNGVLVRTGLTSSAANVYSPTTFAGDGSGYGILNGQLSNLAIYPTALSATDILIHSNAGRPKGFAQAGALIYRLPMFAQATALIDSPIKNVYAQAQAWMLHRVRFAQAAGHIKVATIQYVQHKEAGISDLNPKQVTFDNAPTQGNLLVAIMTHRNSDTASTPSGWTLIDREVGAGSGNSPIYMWYKFAGAGESATTPDFAVGRPVRLSVIEFSGVGRYDSEIGLTFQSASATPTISGLSPTSAVETLLVAGFAVDLADSEHDGFTPGTNYVEIMDGKVGTGTESPRGVGEYRIALVAGPFSASVSTTLSRNWGGILAAFLPAATSKSGQANALIDSPIKVQFAQANAWVIPTTQVAQAMATLKTPIRAAQAQAYIDQRIRLVQWATAHQGNDLAAPTVTLSATPTPGNMIIAYAIARGFGDNYSWTTDGLTEVSDDFAGQGFDGGHSSIAYRIVQAGDDATYTANPNTLGAGRTSDILVTEWTGLKGPALYNTQSGLSATSSMSAGPVTTGLGPRLIFAGVNASSRLPNHTWGSGFTNLGGTLWANGSGPAGSVGYKIINGTGGTETATVSSDQSDTYGYLIIDFGSPTIQFGLAMASILALTSNYGHAQANASIKQTYYKHAQAQASIVYKRWGHSQAQAMLIGIGKSHAICMAFIRRPNGLAQAQATIFTYTGKYAQARAVVKLPEWQLAQAQAHIYTTSHGFAQALALMNQYWAWGQAEGSIKATVNAHAQAQGEVRFSGAHGNAMAFIDKFEGFAQAQGRILAALLSRCAQAQARIVKTWRAYGQAMAMIEQTQSFGYGQCNALINGRSACGQAEAYIGPVRMAHAQAEAFIFDRPRAWAQAQAQISRQDFWLRYGTYTLPGYLQQENSDSGNRLTAHEGPFKDGSLSEDLGLSNKSLNLRFKLLGETYDDLKTEVFKAGSILRSTRGRYEKLYLTNLDRYYLVRPKTISMHSNAADGALRTLEYEVEFDAKPHIYTDVSHTIVGAGNIDTGIRPISEGGWTPARITVTGTNVTVSGYTEYNEFTGYFAVSGAVTNLVIDSDTYTATTNGQNKNNLMRNLDYTIYVGPGRTYFAVSGASNIEVTWSNRW